MKVGSIALIVRPAFSSKELTDKAHRNPQKENHNRERGKRRGQSQDRDQKRSAELHSGNDGIANAAR